MHSPADTFAKFVTWHSRHLDDHDLRGSDLAAELFVSRSVLDRLVSATAGEPRPDFAVAFSSSARRSGCGPPM